MSKRSRSRAKKNQLAIREPQQLSERSFSEILSTAAGSDWITSGMQIDAEVFQNVFAARAAMRDLWRCNAYFAKYQETLGADVFGENGIMLRSKVVETEDRVVHTAGEKAAIRAWENRVNRVRDWAAGKRGVKLTRDQQYRCMVLADRMDGANSGDVPNGLAMIQVGAPDVFARMQIEKAWTEWQRMEFCDARKARSYNTLRLLRLWACARDGADFVVKITDPRVNEFGFALRIVNDEWCDHFYNTTLENGNVVRMGIEYKMTPWGLGERVAYHFIKRLPMDWQTVARYTGNYSIAGRDRVSADQIIHYARVLDTESTRPAPWGMSILGKVRQLDMYEVAEVVAARAEANKTGWLYSDLNPEGGQLTAPDPRTGVPTLRGTPGGLYALPWGVKYQANNPTHPSGNFKDFRQAMGQATAAGLPGGDYNVLFNDLANINFSAGRLGRLDKNEIMKMIQRFDIDTAERPIFESWLEMALIVGAIPLPMSKTKLKKFRQAVFQGRRWAQVDEVKAVQAATLRVANKMSSLQRENADLGQDFEEIAFEQAEELMIQEELGLNPALTVHDQTSDPNQDEEGDDSDEEVDSAPGTDESYNGDEKPKPKKKSTARGIRTTIRRRASFPAGAVHLQLNGSR